MALITCRECGAHISDSATACPQCGSPVVHTATPQSYQNNNAQVCPETHLTKAIIVTLLCCWPLGIPAIVNAAGVSNAFAAGNYQLALQKSNDAEKWSKYCIIAGVVFWVLYIIIIVVAVLLEEL